MKGTQNGAQISTPRSPDQPRAKLTTESRNIGPGATMNRYAIKGVAPQQNYQRTRRMTRG